MKLLHQRGLLPLVPLLLLALISYLHGQLHLNTTLYAEHGSFIAAARCLLPGFFGLSLALMLPSRPAWLLSFLVSINYLWLLTLVMIYAADRFNYPTLCVIAALGSAPLVRPGTEGDNIPESAFILQRLPAFILIPALILFMALGVATGINNYFIANYLRLQDTGWCSLIPPLDLLMRTAGLDSLLHPTYMLRDQDIHSIAAANSMMLSEALILPVIILTRATFSRAPFKLLLSILGCLILVTSHIGECVSLASAMLLIFFPGSYVAGLAASVALYFLCLYLRLDLLADMHLFYHPDLINWNVHLFSRTSGAWLALAGALIIPAALLGTMYLLSQRLHKEARRLNQENTLGYRISPDIPPDLCALTLLRAVGGIGNLESLSQEGTKLLLRLGDPRKAVRQTLLAVCIRRPEFDRDHNLLICDLGASSHSVAGRLSNMLRAVRPWSLRQNDLSQPYIISRRNPGSSKGKAEDKS